MPSKKKSEPEQQAGAPEWMVTFSDCMTLLLTFFVLLLSFSSFDNKDDFMRMSSSFAEQISFAPPDRGEDDAVIFVREQMPNYDIPQGSEKPTSSDEHSNKMKKVTEPSDFLDHKTFMLLSDRAFLGNTAVISGRGRNALSDLSKYLKEFPDHMFIVSESGLQSALESDDSGFQRAWSVIQYLTVQKKLKRSQFSLSATGIAAQDYHMSPEHSRTSERLLEIVIMKRGK